MIRFLFCAEVTPMQRISRVGLRTLVLNPTTAGQFFADMANCHVARPETHRMIELRASGASLPGSSNFARASAHEYRSSCPDPPFLLGGFSAAIAARPAQPNKPIKFAVPPTAPVGPTI